MSSSRVRLVGLLALVVPIGLTAAATGESPALGALALASAAAGLALLLAGRVFRVILAVLNAFLGVSVVLVAIWGPETAPSVLGIVGGSLQVLAGAGVAATASRWPASGARYSRTRLAGDPASDWDALSAGDDPTDQPR